MDDIQAQPQPCNPRFVLFASYGNDSCALIQWASDQGLTDVAAVYSDTGWAATWWPARVERMERWVRSLGYTAHRTQSIGFVELARQKRAFPSNLHQWCSGILKIEPGERWLEENDPERRAVCLVGVRREESEDRSQFPAFLAASPSHGGRVMLAPMVDWSEGVRNQFLERAGIKPLKGRSKECSPCINAKRADIIDAAKDEQRIAEIEALEKELGLGGELTANGRTRGALFRPANKMGATGIREVVEWARAGRGMFGSGQTRMFDDEDLGQSGCVAGWCGA